MSMKGQQKNDHIKVKVNMIKITKQTKPTVRVIGDNSLIMINQNLIMEGPNMNLTMAQNLTSKKTM